MNKFIILTLVGTISGLATGVIGAGPEVLIVPLLAYFNVLDSTKKRIGTSLFMLLPPIGLFAALKFYRNGYVDVKVALYMAFIFTLAASFSAEHSVQLNPNLLRKVFAIFTIILGFYYYFQKDTEK